jgi:hypothetical protein
VKVKKKKTGRLRRLTLNLNFDPVIFLRLFSTSHQLLLCTQLTDRQVDADRQTDASS